MPLATADDVLEADGTDVLSFAQAASASRVCVAAARREERAAAAGTGSQCETACEDYSTAIEARQTAEARKKSQKSLAPACARTWFATPPVGERGALLDRVLVRTLPRCEIRLRAKKLAETTVCRISMRFVLR